MVQKTFETRWWQEIKCSTIAIPCLKDVGIRVAMVVFAIIPALSAYNYTGTSTLVSKVFGTVTIPTS